LKLVECPCAAGKALVPALAPGRKPVNAAQSSTNAGIAAKPNDVGDVALKVVAGFAAGALGVWALDRLDWFMWDQEDPEARARTTAARPDGEPPAQALVSKMEDATGKHLEPGTHEAASQVVHYSIGIAPAIAYALLRDKLPMSGVARGALYGAGLFLTQDEVLNTVTGLGAKPQAYPWQAHARGMVAHTAYGLVAELALVLIDQIRVGRTRAIDGVATGRS
jgi:uncharacterized membrane protein YagU involved in acid resistance